MVDQLAIIDEHAIPDANQLVTEDNIPVDNFASEKQQRLLVSCLYSNLKQQPFLAAANVGIYPTASKPPIVPDVFLSLDVEVPENWWEKQHRCYLVWNFGKPPEIVIEIVSNQIGNELREKLNRYEQMRVSYYIVYDPNQQLGEQPLLIYELRGRRYIKLQEQWLEQVGLGLTLWQGKFEERRDIWLRWCDQEGALLLTGDEQAEQERQRAEQERQRAEQERQRAEQERQRAEQERQRAEQERQQRERLEEFLRSQGINPNQLPELNE
ncbi:MAG: Uma2 family endonuclease [Symploca sp. SIO2E9]|nr:Uma2 family endonuclease [Symploca sp. SIO2E9]